MSWLETKIRRYEHARWTTDDNRRVLPFDWGLEYIGGDANDPDPRAFLNRWVPETIAHSDEWLAATPPTDAHLTPSTSRPEERKYSNVHQFDRIAVAGK